MNPNAVYIFHHFAHESEWKMVQYGMTAEFVMQIWHRVLESRNIGKADYYLRDLIADGWGCDNMDAELEQLAREHLEQKCLSCK